MLVASDTSTNFLKSDVSAWKRQRRQATVNMTQCIQLSGLLLLMARLWEWTNKEQYWTVLVYKNEQFHLKKKNWLFTHPMRSTQLVSELIYSSKDYPHCTLNHHFICAEIDFLLKIFFSVWHTLHVLVYQSPLATCKVFSCLPNISDIFMVTVDTE